MFMKNLILSLLTILVMSSLIGCDFKKESKEYKAENPKFEKSIKFKKIYAPYDDIVALTEDGELYTVVKDKKKDSSRPRPATTRILPATTNQEHTGRTRRQRSGSRCQRAARQSRLEDVVTRD